METFIIYDHCNEKTFCKELVEGLNSKYSLDHLIKFFDEKAKEYFQKYIEHEDKIEEYEEIYGEDYFSPYYDMYKFVLEFKLFFEELKGLKDFGYEFEIVDIKFSEDRYIELFLDNTKLTKNQLSLIRFFSEERF